MNEEMKIIITKELLKELHVSESRLAYPYMLSAMELAFRDPDSLEHITKGIYIDVARKYRTSDLNVERGIRKNIERAWANTERDEELILQVFGEEHVSRRPSNTVFFRCIFEYVCQLQSNPADGNIQGETECERKIQVSCRDLSGSRRAENNRSNR